MTRSAAVATWSPNQDRTTGNTRARGRRLGPRYALGLALGLALACNAERPSDGSPAERGEEAAEPSADERTADRMMDDGMMGDGMMGDMHERMMGAPTQMPDWMMSHAMMDRTMMRDMHVIHGLLSRHAAIRREVELIPGGVRARTTSDDPEVALSIRAHVRQMKSRIEEGRPIRHMDPVFREIFEHHDAIEMRVRNVPGGVVVTETSDDPRVVALIRQHATRAVSEFVAEGMPRAMRPTPLPEGYAPEASPPFAAAEGT